MKPCRHLSSLALGKLSDRLPQIPSINRHLCSSCPKEDSSSFVTEDDNASNFTFVCLTCLETFCCSSEGKKHLTQHARTKNHPLSYNLQCLIPQQEENSLIESEFHCASCADSPKLREPGKKERILLEKIKNLLLENQKNLSLNVVTSSPSSVDNSSSSIAPKGLVNLGNTCFMNSALQLLAATLQRRKRNEETDSKDPIWNSLLHHCEEIYTAASLKSKFKRSSIAASAVNPSEFFKLLIGKQRKFASMQQQDSHDFLRLLFNSIKESSRVDLLFGGKFVSRVICSACRTVSDTIEPFLDISLALQNTLPANLEDSMENLSLKEFDDISQLIELWNRKIILSGENGYYCEACPVPQVQPATLQYFFTPHLPEFLILHLQRFKTHFVAIPSKAKSSSKLQIEKNSRTIKFPLNLTIPVTAFQNAQTPPHHHHHHHQYGLYGYIVHEGGSIDYGHYTAVVSSPSQHQQEQESLPSARWYYISDTKVKEISEAKALDGDSFTPYLLFYQKIH